MLFISIQAKRHRKKTLFKDSMKSHLLW